MGGKELMAVVGVRRTFLLVLTAVILTLVAYGLGRFHSNMVTLRAQELAREAVLIGQQCVGTLLEYDQVVRETMFPPVSPLHPRSLEVNDD